MPRTHSALAPGAAAISLAALDTVLLATALPDFTKQLGLAPAAAAWLLIAFWATVTGTTLLGGRIGDLWGERNVFLAATGLYALGALFCTGQTTLGGLVGGRIVQGIGAAGFLATAPALITMALPPYRRGLGMGVLASAAALGYLCALPLAKVILAPYIWPTFFWFLAGMALLVFAGGWLFLPQERKRQPGKHWLDAQGGILILLAFPALFVAAFLGRRDGWDTIEPLGLAFGAIVGLLWLLRVEREITYPVLDFRLLRNGRFAGALMAGTLSVAMLFTVMHILPVYLDLVKGFSAVSVLMFMAIVPAMALILSPVAGVLADRAGTRGLCVVALCILASGTLWIAELKDATPAWNIALRVTVLGLGFALFLGPNLSAILGSVPPQNLGSGAALATLTLALGTMLGATLASALFPMRFQDETGHTLQDFAANSSSDALAFSIALRLALQVAATLGAPAVLASLMKNRGHTEEPPTLF